MAKTRLFAFAQSDSQPLPALRQEFDKLNSLYIDGQRKDHYNTHWIPYSSKTKLVPVIEYVDTETGMKYIKSGPSGQTLFSNFELVLLPIFHSYTKNHVCWTFF